MKMTFENVKVIFAATVLINIILSDALCTPSTTGILEDNKRFVYSQIQKSEQFTKSFL